MNNKNQTKPTFNSISYKHGNLMMTSTIVCLCTLMVVMLISTAFKSSIASLMLARSVAGALSVLFFAAFVALAVMAKKKDCALWEYSIYSLIMSFGFLSMLGTPFFLPATDAINTLFRTKYVLAGLIAFNVVYLVSALIYHTVKSSHKKN